MLSIFNWNLTFWSFGMKALPWFFVHDVVEVRAGKQWNEPEASEKEVGKAKWCEMRRKFSRNSQSRQYGARQGRTQRAEEQRGKGTRRASGRRVQRKTKAHTGAGFANSASIQPLPLHVFVRHIRGVPTPYLAVFGSLIQSLFFTVVVSRISFVIVAPLSAAFDIRF